MKQKKKQSQKTGNFSQGIEDIKKTQEEISELKNVLTKFKNLRNKLNSRMEERLSELEDRTIDIIQSKQQRENRLEEKRTRLYGPA